MEVTKTVRVPVHYALTKRKLGMLDRLTARLTYCVWLFSQLIDERRIAVDACRHGNEIFEEKDTVRIRDRTRLSSAFIQQCQSQALWMWQSYHVQHMEWERRLRHAKGKWREKLLKREPQKPFHNGLTGKVPIRIDTRTGVVEVSKRMKLTPYVIRLSMLKKHMRITIPLNPADYHLRLLARGRIVDFQLIKRNRWYYAHVCVKHTMPDVRVHAVRGVDLGVRRAIATVLLKPNQPLRQEDLSILRDGPKKHRLDMLNRRVAELQQAEKWEPLKRLRHKRRHIAEQHDRSDAIHIAEMAEREGSMVAVGYPKGVKYESHRGNGERRLRRILQQRFPYNRRIQYVQEECAERGIRAETVLEAWTSKMCHRCGSTNTRRRTQSMFWCLDCGLQYNADWNAAMNIGSVFLPTALSRGVTGGLAYAGEDSAYKPMSPEAETYR